MVAFQSRQGLQWGGPWLPREGFWDLPGLGMALTGIPAPSAAKAGSVLEGLWPPVPLRMVVSMAPQRCRWVCRSLEVGRQALCPAVWRWVLGSCCLALERPLKVAKLLQLPRHPVFEERLSDGDGEPPCLPCGAGVGGCPFSGCS